MTTLYEDEMIGIKNKNRSSTPGRNDSLEILEK
jgi:hypothetical protein